MNIISEVWAENFKGGSFRDKLGQKTLITGPNGSGKSSRSEAILLTYLGYIPGAGKQAGAIFDDFCTVGADSFKTGFNYMGVTFERIFTRSAAGDDPGSGSRQALKINGKRSNKSAFSMRLAAVPKVADLSVFLSYSDQKKLDFIFSMYPPAADVATIAEQIEKETFKRNGLAGRIREAEQALQRLETAASETQAAGNLPEVQADILRIEGRIKLTERAINEAEAEKKREAEAARRAENEKRQAAKLEAEKVDADNRRRAAEIAEATARAAEDRAKDERAQAEAERLKNEAEANARAKAEAKARADIQALPTPEKVNFDDLSRAHNIIIQAHNIITGAGCNVCAARLFLSREVKRIKGGQI